MVRLNLNNTLIRLEFLAFVHILLFLIFSLSLFLLFIFSLMVVGLLASFNLLIFHYKYSSIASGNSSISSISSIQELIVDSPQFRHVYSYMKYIVAKVISDFQLEVITRVKKISIIYCVLMCILCVIYFYLCVCVCVCVCERDERERKLKKDLFVRKQIQNLLFFLSYYSLIFVYRFYLNMHLPIQLF